MDITKLKYLNAKFKSDSSQETQPVLLVLQAKLITAKAFYIIRTTEPKITVCSLSNELLLQQLIPVTPGKLTTNPNVKNK